MNTINKSTGFSPFQLHLGRSPRVLPPFITTTEVAKTPVQLSAQTVIDRLQHDVWEAQDNLLKAKVSQADQANKHQLGIFPFEVGQQVQLSTLHHCCEYKSKDEKHVVKFMPRYDSLYEIIKINPEFSTVTLNLPSTNNIFPVFHMSKILPFIENDKTLFPSRALHPPEPVNMNDNLEHFIDKIIDKKQGRGHNNHKYLVQWMGQGPKNNLWLPVKELENCEALNVWLNLKSTP